MPKRTCEPIPLTGLVFGSLPTQERDLLRQKKATKKPPVTGAINRFLETLLNVRMNDNQKGGKNQPNDFSFKTAIS